MTRGLIAFFSLCALLGAQTPDAKPVRLAIAGLVHGHVSGFLRAAKLRIIYQFAPGKKPISHTYIRLVFIISVFLFT